MMSIMSADNPWKTIASSIVYESPYLAVREDAVIQPGGSPGIYNVIEPKPGVLIVAETPQQELYLMKIYRYPLKDWRWEVPGGGIDEGDTPLVAAQKELREELGITAAEWIALGDMYPSNSGPMCDHNYVYLARGLTVAAASPESGEAISAPVALPRKTVLAMVRSGEITDGQTLGVLLHYLPWTENEAAAHPTKQRP